MSSMTPLEKTPMFAAFMQKSNSSMPKLKPGATLFEADKENTRGGARRAQRGRAR